MELVTAKLQFFLWNLQFQKISILSPRRAKEILRGGGSKGGDFRGEWEWPFQVFFPVFQRSLTIFDLCIKIQLSSAQE